MALKDTALKENSSVPRPQKTKKKQKKQKKKRNIRRRRRRRRSSRIKIGGEGVRRRRGRFSWWIGSGEDAARTRNDSREPRLPSSAGIGPESSI